MTSEEFFMYLIIGLIIVAPLVARLYRRITLNRTTNLLHEQLHMASRSEPPKGSSSQQE